MFHVPFYNLHKDCCRKTVAATFAFLWFVCFWLLFECEMHLLCFVRKFVCACVCGRACTRRLFLCVEVCMCMQKKKIFPFGDLYLCGTVKRHF